MKKIKIAVVIGVSKGRSSGSAVSRPSPEVEFSCINIRNPEGIDLKR